MKVWIKVTTRTREGIGPGFPDTRVVDDVEVFDYSIVGGFEREVRSLRACDCPNGWLPTADKLGHCTKCHGSLMGRVTTSTTLLRG